MTPKTSTSTLQEPARLTGLGRRKIAGSGSAFVSSRAFVCGGEGRQCGGVGGRVRKPDRRSQSRDKGEKNDMTATCNICQRHHTVTGAGSRVTGQIRHTQGCLTPPRDLPPHLLLTERLSLVNWNSALTVVRALVRWPSHLRVFTDRNLFHLSLRDRVNDLRNKTAFYTSSPLPNMKHT